MATIPKALLAPLGVGTAAMAAALLGDGSEAEAAVSPKFKELFVDALITGSKKPIYAGKYEDIPYSRLLKIYPEAQNSVWVSPDHPLVRRMETHGWSAERTADEIGNLLNSPDTEFVKNWSKKITQVNTGHCCRMTLTLYSLRLILSAANLDIERFSPRIGAI